MQFAYRIFEQGSDTLLAISDADIVGKTLPSEEVEITVSKEFYYGKMCDEKEAVRLASTATIVNAIGMEIINLLSKKGFIDNKSVLLVGDVPHAQIIAIK